MAFFDRDRPVTGAVARSPNLFSRSVAALCGRYNNQYAPIMIREMQMKVEIVIISNMALDWSLVFGFWSLASVDFINNCR